MGFYKKIKYYLVHSLSFTNKQAQTLIDDGDLAIDGQIVIENCLLDSNSEIKIKDKIVRAATVYIYLKFYKPVGYQSTLNENVKDNLAQFFKNYPPLAIAGRLDKQSEGLLLLSNDGKWVENLCNPQFEKTKEYIVQVDQPVDVHFVNAFKNGVKIGTYTTKPCHCEILSPTQIKVILTEGKNRQIRRMCKTLGFGVVNLQRIKIEHISLQDLKPGTFEHIQNDKFLTL